MSIWARETKRKEQRRRGTTTKITRNKQFKFKNLRSKDKEEQGQEMDNI
jgi:hypothetical protein